MNRRQFFKDSGLSALGATFAVHTVTAQTRGKSGDGLRVGLIGCGGRGTGADPNTRLVTMADGFEDRIASSLATLRSQAVTWDQALNSQEDLSPSAMPGTPPLPPPRWQYPA